MEPVLPTDASASTGPAGEGSTEQVQDALLESAPISHEAASQASEAPSEAADAGEPFRNPYADIREESYVPQTLLVSTEGQDVRVLCERLSALDYVEGVEADDADLDAGFVIVSLREGASVADAAGDLLQAGVSAQPDFVYYLMDSVDGEGAADVLQVAAGDEWSQSDGEQWNLESVDAVDAWQIAESAGGRSSVTVAVIDSGCNVKHEDLQGRFAGAYDVLESKSGTANMTDTGGHGTHVSGIIAANYNGLGVAGTSFDAKIYPVKVMTESTTDSAVLAKAYQHVIGVASTYNIKVVNLSIGSCLTSGENQDDRMLERWMNQAYRSGILTVAAAGNASSSQTAPFKCFPCDYVTSTLGVINLDHSTSGTANDAAGAYRVSRASGSNYNTASQTQSTSAKDLSAPGTSIKSTYISTSSSYKQLNGTSMAAPCVAGAAALIFSLDSSLTPANVSTILCDSAKDLGDSGWDAEYGYGELDMLEAVTDALSSISGDNAIMVGGTLQLQASGVVSGSWSSSDASVATVSSSGLVTGVAEGAATISAQVRGRGRSGTSTAGIQISVYDPSVSGAASLLCGSSTSYSMNSTLDGIWVWSSSDTSVASVDAADGVVSGIGPGTATITGTLATSDKVYAQKTITVAAQDISKASVVVPTQKYTGSAVKAVPSSVKVGGTTLKMGTDFTISSYADNILTGTAKLTIKGKGAYQGTKTVSFSIIDNLVAGHVYEIYAKLSTGKVVDVANGSKISGANVQSYLANRTRAQRWKVYRNADSTVTLVNANSGRALGIAGKKSGANVKQVALTFAKAQRWTVSIDAKGYCTLKNKASGMVLAIAGSSKANGANILQTKGTQSASQKWTFVDISAKRSTLDALAAKSLGTLSSGKYYLHSSLKRSKVLEVAGASKRNRANVQLSSQKKTRAQRWKISFDSKGYATIRNVNSGKVLEVAGGSKRNGADVRQNASKGTWAQKWILVKAGSSYTIRSALWPNLALDLSGSGVKNGTNLQICTYKATKTQRFVLSRA